MSLKKLTGGAGGFGVHGARLAAGPLRADVRAALKIKHKGGVFVLCDGWSMRKKDMNGPRTSDSGLTLLLHCLLFCSLLLDCTRSITATVHTHNTPSHPFIIPSC